MSDAHEAIRTLPIITGRYADAFTCAAGTWRFARRQFFVDAVGDLSHHLTYAVRR